MSYFSSAPLPKTGILPAIDPLNTVPEMVEALKYNRVILNVSEDGSSLTRGVVEGGDPSKKDHQSLKEISGIKTHELMLQFLEKYQADIAFRGSVMLYHKNCSDPNFPGHSDCPSMNFLATPLKGTYHQDTVESLIDYVKSRFKEKSLVLYYYNKYEKSLDKTYAVLTYYSKIPLIGILPSSTRALLGLVQTMAGFSFFLISSLFAPFSNNAYAALKKSLRQIGLGPLNIVSGLCNIIFFGVMGAGLFIEDKD